ncbi:hypothetical protein PHLGIDRAFT_429840 [Phlebiopsis gigantea 11061_1 CR5-6]|uniref:Secreted protein n=1 Tax=Phlebiopsis gigantea (strain 11061_1 CR5-6) TaxID=745531 RepID=A0A0C3RYI5_PHLG1|nr:hypothetical protein PHLGIDRAFT_429840 [Phlebiopsis gigantea 11061_1 CR5-6]
MAGTVFALSVLVYPLTSDCFGRRNWALDPGPVMSIRHDIRHDPCTTMYSILLKDYVVDAETDTVGVKPGFGCPQDVKSR